MMNKIIFLNGPPQSGKDYIGEKLKQKLEQLNVDVRIEKFARPIKDAITAIYQLSPEQKHTILETHDGKSKEHESLRGQNGRQVQIDFSEKIMKPYYGDDIFGKLFLCRQKPIVKDTVTIVTDSGFAGELNSVIENLPDADIYTFKIKRDGTSYSGDSRAYLKEEDLLPVTMSWVDNNKNIDDVVTEILTRANI